VPKRSQAPEHRVFRPFRESVTRYVGHGQGGAGRYVGGAEQKPWGGQGFTAPNDILHRDVKLARASAALGRFCLRRGADLPQMGRPQ
jgi:hypothetical protein